MTALRQIHPLSGFDTAATVEADRLCRTRIYTPNDHRQIISDFEFGDETGETKVPNR